MKIEDYDSMLRSGETWFLDCSSDDAECQPHADNIKLELWGGLYASGHLELGGPEVQCFDVVEVVRTVFVKHGFKPVLDQRENLSAHSVFATGLRAILGTRAALFALHMDAEIAIEYQRYRSQFDAITNDILSGISNICQDKSVELKNPMDLDFTYTDAAKFFSVLRSDSANEIADPLAIAIRDWHRSRESPS